MRTWTVDEMLSESPCPEYTRERLEGLRKGRSSLSLLEITYLRIPTADRLWAAFCPHALTATQQSAWLERICKRAIRKYALPNPLTRDWARDWLSGEDRSAAAAGEACTATWASWATCAAAGWAAEAAEAAGEAAETEAAAAAGVSEASWRAARAAEAAAAAAEVETEAAARAAEVAEAAARAARVAEGGAAWAEELELQLADLRKVLKA